MNGRTKLVCILLISGLSSSKGGDCGSNDFQDYFDDAKESRVKQIPKIQESSFKNQDSRLKIQESREDLIKISTKKVFQNIE